jgi:uncharacterized protein YqjF (DUF2071 family)
VLFLHWPVEDGPLLAQLPAGLELDRWEGSAWVSIVAFRLAKVRLLGLPPIPLCTDILEVNVRTYVRLRGEPGIYFLQMYGDGLIAVAAARLLTPLPYRYCPMRCRFEGGAWHWQCGATAAGSAALLAGEFEAECNPQRAAAGSLEEWLVERYQAFVPDRGGRLCRMEVDHPPWEIARVAGQISGAQCVAGFAGGATALPELCHFSSGVQSWLAPLEPGSGTRQSSGAY